MATHSSVLAWRIPGTGEPGWLRSMGSHRVGPDRSDLAAAATHKKESVKSQRVLISVLITSLLYFAFYLILQPLEIVAFWYPWA